jgi:hypothetical protein
MFTYAFHILKEHLTASVPELREIDWYLQQDSTTDKNVWLYASPVLFLEFSVVGDIRDHGGRIQSALVDLTVHLLTENARDNGKIVKKETSVDHMMVFDKVFKNLQGFSAKKSVLAEFSAIEIDQRVFNSLTRNGIVAPHKIRKTMIKSEQRFRAVFYDHAAVKAYTRPDPAPALDVSVTLGEPVLSVEEGTFDETFDETFD